MLYRPVGYSRRNQSRSICVKDWALMARDPFHFVDAERVLGTEGQVFTVLASAIFD
jgi:hypothetical protein